MLLYTVCEFLQVKWLIYVKALNAVPDLVNVYHFCIKPLSVYVHIHIFLWGITEKNWTPCSMSFQVCPFVWVFSVQFSSVQSLSRVRLFATPWTAARQASLSITNSRSPPKPMSIELVIPSNRFIVCCPLLLLPSIFPSIRVFSNESALHIQWPNIGVSASTSSFSIIHPGLISFRMDWLDLLAVRGTLKSLLQHHSSKASIFLRSAFFIVQLSDPYMTTGKTIALTGWTFVDKVMSLLFNKLSRLVITFFLRNKHLLISWLQSPSVVIKKS